VAALLTPLSAAWAQQPTMRIGYVFPAGARQGTSAVVVIGGRSLDGTTQAHVSGAGVTAKVVDYLRSTSTNELNTLVGKLRKLEPKNPSAPKESERRAAPAEVRAPEPAPSARTADDQLLLAAFKRKVAAFVGGPPVPAIGESVFVQLTIAPNAEPGRREIRLETSRGLTNPLTFCVGQLPEFFSEANLSEELLSGKAFSTYRDEPKLKPPGPPTGVTLPAILNGQITPGGADRYRFQARNGQQLVVAASAEQLIPYISDAVPGWFQAHLTLYDAKGKELASADHHLFHPDPVLCYEVREDGEYVLAIRDSLYRGREDFVYRVTLGEVPFVTSIFPLGGRAGTQTTVDLTGWNLPVDRITQDSQDKGPGIYPLLVRKGRLVSNVLSFAVDTLPECREKEPNNRPAEAQPITLPLIVNGRIDQPDDVDVFRFAGRASQEIVAEVHARRLGSPLDSVLTLTDAAGKQLAMNDDHVDKGAGLTTHQADSYLRCTLPTDGSYCLLLGDAQHKGGAEYGYRLRIGLPRPDFDLRIVPSSWTMRGSTTVPVMVYALRRDGFDGQIELALKDAREGHTLAEASVPAGEDHVKLTLKIPPMPPGEPIRLSIEGRATIGGQEVSHVAVPAEDMTQAFEYRHLVPAQELKVAMVGRFDFRPSVKLLSKTPLKIPVGGTAKVQIGVSPRWMLGKQQVVSLRSAPQGISVGEVSATREGMEVVVQTDAAKVKPGQRGSLSLAAAAPKPAEPDKTKTPASQQPRLSLPSLPSVPFEIVKP
jgi:hypothetical protein